MEKMDIKRNNQTARSGRCKHPAAKPARAQQSQPARSKTSPRTAKPARAQQSQPARSKASPRTAKPARAQRREAASRLYPDAWGFSRLSRGDRTSGR
jgi:hypothetical protein